MADPPTQSLQEQDPPVGGTHEVHVERAGAAEPSAHEGPQPTAGEPQQQQQQRASSRSCSPNTRQGEREERPSEDSLAQHRAGDQPSRPGGSKQGGCMEGPPAGTRAVPMQEQEQAEGSERERASDEPADAVSAQRAHVQAELDSVLKELQHATSKHRNVLRIASNTDTLMRVNARVRASNAQLAQEHQVLQAERSRLQAEVDTLRGQAQAEAQAHLMPHPPGQQQSPVGADQAPTRQDPGPH